MKFVLEAMAVRKVHFIEYFPIMFKTVHHLTHAAVLLAFLLPLQGNTTWAQSELWIMRGTWNTFPDSVPALRLESDSIWTGRNAAISRPADIPSSITVHNTDSLDHLCALIADASESTLIPAGSSAIIEMPALPLGVHRLGLVDTIGDRLGAVSMVQAGLTELTADEADLFYWNLGDWNTESIWQIDAGDYTGEGESYMPNQFTINEQSYPATTEDPNGAIEVQLGDTCWIAIANHGLMDHVLHFHGFHVLIETSTHHPERIGWSKDTVPIKRGEGMTLRLIANLPGTYPVHNHNLIAVTNAGFYPGGMITHINVQP